MEMLLKKFSKMFLKHTKTKSGCDGCAYHRNSNCNLYVITEDWVSVKAKDGCDDYLHKDELLRR
jgi:hypothetical protein